MRWTSSSPPPVLFGSSTQGRFGPRARRARGHRIPVFVVTGFLGAGKTTLVKRFLEEPSGADTAVIVNEFGSVGIDDALLRSSTDTTVLLGNGCMCCSIRSDLQETLRVLFLDRRRGAIPSFERVVIETSGLADPVPILQTIATDAALGETYHLEAVITVVDPTHFARTLAEAPEAPSQVAAADCLVVTKLDLAGGETVAALDAQLHALNPTAAIVLAAPDQAVGATVFATPASPRPQARNRPAAHSSGIGSFALTFDAPLRWPLFARTMSLITDLRGPDILRIKGLLAVEGCDGPLVVHYVRHVAYPPVELSEWPGAPQSSLVFIGRDLSREAVAGAFSAVSLLAQAGSRA